MRLRYAIWGAALVLSNEPGKKGGPEGEGEIAWTSLNITGWPFRPARYKTYF